MQNDNVLFYSVLTVLILSIAAAITVMVVAISSGSGKGLSIQPSLYFNGATLYPVIWNSVTHLSVDVSAPVSTWSSNQNFTVEWFQNLGSGSINAEPFSMGYDAGGGTASTALAASFQGPLQQNMYLLAKTENVFQAPVFFDDNVQNTWHHVAMVRAAGTMSIFADGRMIQQFLFPFDFSTMPSCTVTLANEPPLYNDIDAIFKGYISNFRITEGALYTANFDVPNAPLPATTFSTTVWLKNATNATAFSDSGSYGLVVSQTNVEWVA